jgi:uncharacterized membrane protein
MDWMKSHIAPLIVTFALVAYSLARNKLTLEGVVAAATTALIHMSHPQPVFFNLLVAFFLTGTIATRVNHAKKASLTQSANGTHGGEGPRNSSQVIANSAMASLLILWDLYCIHNNPAHKSDRRVFIGIIA